MRRALISVTDKSGVVEFAQGIADLGFEVVSTGGTAKALREAGLEPVDVAAITGFPEMLDGRLKTLHPMVHGAILGDRRNPDHVRQMDKVGLIGIEVLAVNLYAFEQTVTGKHSFEDAVESIDIGGPAMVRGAAKNHANVLVVVDPADYPRVLQALSDGDVDSLRRELAAKAFQHTAYYDSVIARYLSQADAGFMPETLTLGLRKALDFRYGENPHQSAAMYVDPLSSGGLARAEQLWGKELSYNNIADANAAIMLVMDLPERGCAIIKHANPCGAAWGSSYGEAYRFARETDPVSAFGGIAAFNGTVDEEAANAMTEKGNFLEVVAAPSITPEAMRIFQNRTGWGQNVRLLEVRLSTGVSLPSVKTIPGGAIVQSWDRADSEADWTCATASAPSDAQHEALRLQWRIVRHVKSNAIVVGNARQLLGIGAGQMNRVQSVRLALEQAGESARGAVLASDAFFPFPDSIEVAARAGISAIIQPGGSKKDEDVIAAANRSGIAMILTGARHFNH